MLVKALVPCVPTALAQTRAAGELKSNANSQGQMANIYLFIFSRDVRDIGGAGDYRKQTKTNQCPSSLRGRTTDPLPSLILSLKTHYLIRESYVKIKAEFNAA